MSLKGIDLRKKRALITGGGRGLGRSIAEALSRAGATLAITSRDGEAARRAAEAIQGSTGGPVIGLAADVTQVPSIQRAVEEACARMGGLDVLVNNAGVAVTRWAIELSEEEWDTILDTNLKGLFFASQAAARHMKDHGGGVIVNLASVAGLRGERALAPYCASKAGVVNLTRALAVEWARFGIRVVAVAPAYVETDLNREALANPKVRDQVIARTPLRRLGLPEEVAAAVAYLASDAAAYITGVTLPIDGGWLAS